MAPCPLDRLFRETANRRPAPRHLLPDAVPSAASSSTSLSPDSRTSACRRRRRHATHADHSPAAKVIKENIDCTSYGYGPYKRKKFDTNFEEGHDLTFKPDIYLNDGELVNGDGWTIRAIHTPGHTSNHMCYGLEEQLILFTGDHIMGWSTTVIVPPDGNMTSYIESLKKVLNYKYKIFYPTHGGPITKPRQFVNALIAHRLMRQTQIINELSKNNLTIKEMVSKFYKTTDKRLWPAAEKSILANLLSLKDKGVVVDEDNKKVKWKVI